MPLGAALKDKSLLINMAAITESDFIQNLVQAPLRLKKRTMVNYRHICAKLMVGQLWALFGVNSNINSLKFSGAYQSFFKT